MTVTLGNYIGEPNKVDKEIANTTTFEGYLRTAAEVINPVIRFETEPITSVNYMYIPIFGRYYFITKLTVINAGMWEVTGHCDVLMSYKNDIRSWYAVVERGETQYNLYLNDPEFQVEQRPRVQLLKFPAGFARSYAQRILILAGNGGN